MPAHTVDPNLFRPDGRPEAYDVPPNFAPAPCVLCIAENKLGVRYGYRELFMCSPVDALDAAPHLVCKGHLPADIVILDPMVNMCRNKDGSDVWHEPDGVASFRPFNKKTI